MKRAPGFAVGMPTVIDVARMVDAFGVPAVGATIPYERIEEVLRLTRTQTRWHTVVSAWRKKLEEEHNLLLRAIPAEGFEVLDNPGRVDVTTRGYQSGLRKVVRNGDRAARTSDDGLTPEQRRTRDSIARTAGALKIQAALAARKLRELPPTVEVKARERQE